LKLARVVLGVALLATQLGSASRAAAKDDIAPFTARGAVLTEVFQKAGATNATFRMEREACYSYSNGWWWVELKGNSGSFQTNIFHKPISAEQLAGSMTDCRNLSDGVRLVITTRKALGTAAVSNIAMMAFVEPTAFPPPEMNDLFVCWLTLCPNPELPVIDGNKMRRLISAKFLKDPKNQAEYALKYSGPGNVFLSELCITNDGVVPIHDGTLRKMPPPFDKGYPEFEFKVLETTNWNGLVFPLRSMLHKYVPLPGATNRDDLFPSVTARLNLESFHAGFERPEVDLTRSKLIANDNRLPHLPQTASIRYIVMNDQWLPATNPALAQLAAAYNAAAKASPVRNDAGLTAQKRFIVLMVMLALTLGPVASFALIRNNRKNQQKNQQKKYYENINE
jgi:hypothetical protein